MGGGGDPALATETISHIRQVALCSITGTPVPPSGVGVSGDPALATETISHIRQVALCSVYHWHTCTPPPPPSGVGGPGDPTLATETISHIRQVALCSITGTPVPPHWSGGAWRPRPSNRDNLTHQTGSALFYHWHTCTPQWGGWGEISIWINPSWRILVGCNSMVVCPLTV